MEFPETPGIEKFLFSLNLLSLCLLAFMVISHIFGAPTLSITVLPISSDQSMKKFFESEVGDALCRFISMEALYILGFGVISLFVITLSIYLAIAFCTEKWRLTINDMPWRIVGTWKRLIITWIYVTLLAISYALSMVLFINNAAAAFEDIVLNIMVLLVVVFFSMHLIVVWVIGSILDVLEEEFCELDDPLAEEEFLMLRMEKGGDEQRENVSYCWMKIEWLKFLLVLTASSIASYGLVEFGLNKEHDNLKARAVITIVSTWLFLSMELLIFVVFVVFYWGMKRAVEERWAKNRGFCILCLPSAMVLILLALDQKRVFSYVDLCKVL